MIGSSPVIQESPPVRASRARMFSALGYSSVEGLPSKHEALGSFPTPGGWGVGGKADFLPPPKL